MTSIRHLLLVAAVSLFPAAECQDPSSSSRLRCQCSLDTDKDNVFGITCSRGGAPGETNELFQGDMREASCSKDVSPYYYFFTQSMNWTQAVQKCRRMFNARLAVPRSRQQVEDLLPLFKRHPIPPYPSGLQYAIIGFYYDKLRDEFVTVEGDSVEDSGYTRWGRGQPNRNGEECGTIDSRGELHDIHCREEYPSICQIN